ARFTVIRRGGYTKPALRMAPRTRSRDSCRAASARPTIEKPGSPGATSTSTRMILPSRPCNVAERTVASTPGAYRRALTSPLSGSDGRDLSAAGGRGELGRRGGRDLVDAARELEKRSPEQRVGLGEHERRARVQRADRAAVFVDDLVVDRPLERALRVLDVDARERVRTVEDEVHLGLLVPEVSDRLQHEADVLEAGEVRRHDHENRVGCVQDAQVVL